MVCIRFISVPFSVVCLVDGYDYTRSTNIAQVGLRKPLETLGFIGVSRSAYRAYSRRVSGAARTRQAGHGARTCGQIGRARQGGRDGHGSDRRTCSREHRRGRGVRYARHRYAYARVTRVRPYAHIRACAHIRARARTPTGGTPGRGRVPRIIYKWPLGCLVLAVNAS